MEGPPYHHADGRLRLDAAQVQAPVRALLGDPATEVRSVSCQPVVYDSWSRASDGLYLVRGTAVAHGVEQTWEMILKQVRQRSWTPSRRDLARQIDDGGDSADDWAYWRREALALASPELAAAVSAGFRAPACLAVEELGADRLWLWLEHVGGTPGTDWKADDLLATVEEVGAFHARSLDSVGADREWYCRPFLEQAALQERFALIDLVAQATTDQALGDLVSPADASALQALRDSHALVVARLRTMPAALLHRDLTPRNLFRTTDGTVAIDWGQTGRGPAGEDLATLVLTSATVDGLDPVEVGELGHSALERHRADGRLDPVETALAYRLVGAYHFGLPLVRMVDRLLASDDDDRAEAIQDPETRRRMAVMSSLLAGALPDLRELHG